jgi:hypothetical protein
MVVEHYMDLQDDTGQIDIRASRCTSCGEVIDQVILENRFKPAPNLLYGTKERNFAQRVGESGSSSTSPSSEAGDHEAPQKE